jgi:transcriptional regulator with XRE-family HTH domain
MNMIAAGAYLKTLRKAQGLSQESLAALIGVAGNTIYRIEAGRQEPLTPQIVNLLAVLKGHAEDMAKLINDAAATEDDGQREAERRILLFAAQAPVSERKAIADRLRRMADDLEAGRDS